MPKCTTMHIHEKISQTHFTERFHVGYFGEIWRGVPPMVGTVMQFSSILLRWRISIL